MRARASRRGGGHLPFPEVRRARASRRSVVAVADALLIFDPGAPPRLRNAESSEGDRQTHNPKSKLPAAARAGGDRAAKGRPWMFYHVRSQLCCTTNPR